MVDGGWWMVEENDRPGGLRYQKKETFNGQDKSYPTERKRCRPGGLQYPIKRTGGFETRPYKCRTRVSNLRKRNIQGTG